MTRSMVPILSPSERRTGVPSTLSLAMRLWVSRTSAAPPAVPVVAAVVPNVVFVAMSSLL